MKIENIIETPLNGLKIIEFARFSDHRGSFSEIWSEELNVEIGIDRFYQMNEAFCMPRSIRGLHFQWSPYMGKLVRSLEGFIYDYVVDIRLGSPTEGKAIIIDLVGYSNKWLWVPPGFAHCVFTEIASRIQYFCSGKYNNMSECAIHPFSKDIDYSLCNNDDLETFERVKKSHLISEKDSKAMQLKEWFQDERSKNFTYGNC